MVGVAFSVGYMLGQHRVRTAQLPTGHWQQSVEPGESLLEMLAKVERVSSVSALGAVSYPRLLSDGEAAVGPAEGSWAFQPSLEDSLQPHPGFREPEAMAAPDWGFGVVAGEVGARDKALALASRLTALGLPISLSLERRDGEPSWGVRVGPFDTQELAFEARKSLTPLFMESDITDVDVVDFSADGKSITASNDP